MAIPQVVVAPCALPGSPGSHDVTPGSGVIHVNVRHLSGFTVIGNHLAQHRGLSLTAIDLAAHIQSLPAGTRVGIKALSARFPESEARIAAALNELEATGYLLRSRLRLTGGRVVTRTTSFNQPITATPPPPPPPRRRLVAQEPPPPPDPAPEIDPFQDCDRCDRVFRAPEPGHCRDCREAEARGAA